MSAFPLVTETRFHSVEIEERDGSWLAMVREIKDHAAARETVELVQADYPHKRVRLVRETRRQEILATYDPAGATS